MAHELRAAYGQPTVTSVPIPFRSAQFDRELVNLRLDLMRFARVLTQGRPSAEDLVQDTLLKAMTHAEGYKPELPMKAWLFTIMHNQHIDGARKARVKAKLEGEYDFRQAVHRQHATYANPAQQIDLARALAGLPESKAQIVIRADVLGESYSHIQEVFGLCENTVKTLVRRGRQALQVQLGEAYAC